MANTGAVRRVNGLIATLETPINTLRREIMHILRPNPRNDFHGVFRVYLTACD